ncbi:MAG: hypothetical protein GC162_03645 [Planctomycetes bacterium]|nr:hypothetical protein [Planctomycetota bacterium]
MLTNVLAMGGYTGILGIVYLILVIIALIDIIKGSMDSTKKLIWVLVTIFVPYVGAILYFLIGKK